MWGVNRIERDIQKERFVFGLLANQTCGFFCEQKCAITFLPANLVIAMPIETAIARMIEVINGAIVVAILMIESPDGWQVRAVKMAQVPFAANRSRIAGGLKSLRQGPFFERQP